MYRKTFLKYLALVPVAGVAMKLDVFGKITDMMNTEEKMPVLFVGHGSPMNAIEDNEFAAGWRTIASSLPKPKAVLCVSAHWETAGTFVTMAEKPKTIHDFGGFPEALFAVEYPAPGSPAFAGETQKTVKKTSVGPDLRWGLDHGCWSVLRRMYPAAEVPVFQLSIDYNKDAQYHYDLGKELAALRRKGVLILGSGNMVHNLAMVAWDKMDEIGYGFDWALEANDKMKQFIMAGDHKSLINFRSQGKAFDMAIPTPEHYLPLLYALSLKEENETISFFNDKAVAGSLTMTSVKIG